MAFKINIDRFGFAEKPNPDKTCRDYTIGYLTKFINDEAEERISADNALQDAFQESLSVETETRINEDSHILSKLQAETDEIWAHINSIQENVYTKSEVDSTTGYLEAESGDIKNSICDIETALDSIIAIQNTLIGGGTV